MPAVRHGARAGGVALMAVLVVLGWHRLVALLWALLSALVAARAGVSFGGELQRATAPGDVEPQEACYEKALAVARDQCSRALELRAATSLARVWADRGEPRKAEDLLTPIYNCFTEGFDAADLKAAKALLDGLS